MSSASIRQQGFLLGGRERLYVHAVGANVLNLLKCRHESYLTKKKEREKYTREKLILRKFPFDTQNFSVMMMKIVETFFWLGSVRCVCCVRVEKEVSRKMSSHHSYVKVF